MPGLIPKIGRDGNRLEYLAHYILSKIGAATPAPRPEDIGIDFFCNLGEDHPKGITTSTSFAVQLKAGKKRQMELGGYTSAKKDKTWRDYEMKWFLNLEIPLLFGVPDPDAQELSLYSTSIGRFATTREKLPFQMVFKGSPEDENSEDLHPPKKGKDKKLEDIPTGCDGDVWKYDLGPPVIRCSIDDLNDENKVVQYRKRLGEVLETEHLNCIYRSLGLPYWTWLVRCKTNDSHKLAWYHHIASHEPTTETLLKVLVPFISSLGLNYLSEGKSDELKDLKSIAKKLPKDWVPKEIEEKLAILFGAVGGSSAATLPDYSQSGKSDSTITQSMSGIAPGVNEKG